MNPHSPSQNQKPLQDSWVARFVRFAARWVPDAFSASILLLVLVFIVALSIGNTVTATLDAYYRGLWMLLPFTMQMVLILVLSSVLGNTPAFYNIILWLSRRSNSARQVIALSVLLTAMLSYLYWGLGVTLGPFIAIHFAEQAERKGIAIDFPFLLALTVAATSVWQYGLSSSGPLLMATPGHFLEATTGILPLSSTIWSRAAIVQVISFSLALIAFASLLMPKKAQSISQFPESFELANLAPKNQERKSEEIRDVRNLSFSEKLEHKSFIVAILCVALSGWLVYHFWIKRAGLDLNSLNTILLLLCLILHKNLRNFSKALQVAVTSCWSILVLYHLYAGVAGIIQFTTVGASFAGLFANVSSRYTFPLLTAIAGAVVAIFVPSSGGQWALQGYVTTTAAQGVGVSAQRGLLSLGVGDQLGTLVSPFWYVVTAGIARVDFRVFFGYGLIFGVLWFVLGVVVFTFLPS